MNRHCILAAVFCSALSCCTSAWATNPVNKLGRGIINIPTSVAEIPRAYGESKERLDGYSRQHPLEFLVPTVNIPYQYLFKAPVTGIARMVRRVAVGCYDIATFPFSLPRYYKPVYEPEFVFDSMPYAFKLYNRGAEYIDRQKYRSAIAMFTQVLNIDPANAEAFYNRGRAYYMIGEYRRSIDDLNAAESLGYHPELEYIKSPEGY